MLRRGSPAQTVGERRGSGGVTLPVERRAVSPGAQRPEGGGGARQVQADVPERVYGGGDAAAGSGRDTRMKTHLFPSTTPQMPLHRQPPPQTGGGDSGDLGEAPSWASSFAEAGS